MEEKALDYILLLLKFILTLLKQLGIYITPFDIGFESGSEQSLANAEVSAEVCSYWDSAAEHVGRTLVYS